MTDVQILGPTPAERDLESAIEDALDARTVPYSPDAGLYVVDAETPAAIVRAMRELGWREPLKPTEVKVYGGADAVYDKAPDGTLTLTNPHQAAWAPLVVTPVEQRLAESYQAWLRKYVEALDERLLSDEPP